MREFQRIDRIILKLKDLWEQNPDMRLGQLIENFAIQTRGDIWFQEDDLTEKNIDFYLRELLKGKEKLGGE